MSHLRGPNSSIRPRPLSRPVGFAALLLCTVALPGCVGTTASQDAAPAVTAVAQPALNDGLYTRGKTFFQQGQYGLALEAFTRSLQQHPGSVRELNAIAACYDRMQRYDLADQLYRQALAIDPNSVVTLNNLGYSHLMRGERTGDAEQVSFAWNYFEKARQIDGNNPVIAANLSKASSILAATELNTTTDDLASALEGPVKLAEPSRSAWVERINLKTVRVVTNAHTGVHEYAENSNLPVDIVSIAAAQNPEALKSKPANEPTMVASAEADTSVSPIPSIATSAPAANGLPETAIVSEVVDDSGDLIEGRPAALAAVAEEPLAPTPLSTSVASVPVRHLHAEFIVDQPCDLCVAEVPFLRDKTPVGLLAEGDRFVQIAALPSTEFGTGVIEGPSPLLTTGSDEATFRPQTKQRAEGAAIAQVPYVERPFSWLADLVLAD